MAVEMFRGKYVNAESATNYIDINSISEGCQMMKDAADKLNDISKKIDLLKEICNKEALSVQGVSMEDIIEMYEKNTKDMSLYISELSDTVLSTTQRVVNRKQIILNEAAKIDEQKEAALREDVDDLNLVNSQIDVNE